MATSDSYNLKSKARFFKGDWVFVAPVVNVDGGTIALDGSGDWERMPAMDTLKIKLLLDKQEGKLLSGAKPTDVSVIGAEITAQYQQRDAATINLWKDYHGKKVVLLAQGAYLRKLDTPKQQYILAYGEILPSDAEIDSDSGLPTFMFNGLPNAQDIVIAGTPGTGELAFPSITGFTAPSSDLTLDTHDGVDGIVAFIDV